MRACRLAIAVMTVCAVAISPVAAAWLPCCCSASGSSRSSCCRGGVREAEAASECCCLQDVSPRCAATKQEACRCGKASLAVFGGGSEASKLLTHTDRDISWLQPALLNTNPVLSVSLPSGSLTSVGPPLLALYCVWRK